jgi:hypothetical protein
MDVDLFHDLTIRVSLYGLRQAQLFIVFKYIVARRALTSIFLIFYQDAFVSDYAIAPPAQSYAGKFLFQQYRLALCGDYW